MNVNFGLFPPLPPGTPRNERKPAMARRALDALAAWDATKGPAVVEPCESRRFG
jgi:methylenetetrahydrofolate--tRNA-(uracil-5-)-methyltransferase